MKKMSYVNLTFDEGVHEGYERALGKAASVFGRSHPMIIGGKEV